MSLTFGLLLFLGLSPAPDFNERIEVRCAPDSVTRKSPTECKSLPCANATNGSCFIEAEPCIRCAGAADPSLGFIFQNLGSTLFRDEARIVDFWTDLGTKDWITFSPKSVFNFFTAYGDEDYQETLNVLCRTKSPFYSGAMVIGTRRKSFGSEPWAAEWLICQELGTENPHFYR